MIIDEADTTAHGATLDDLFRRAGVRHPQAPALVDPPNRESFTDGAPRHLSFAAADRAISALAARLRELGLPTDTVIAIQLGNTVEAVIALLAVLRAGLIAAPLPLLWRRQEMAAALQCAGAKAIITASRIGDDAAADTALQAAADVFAIRYVCGFGRDLPDGVVPLDPCFADRGEALQHTPRPGPAAAHIAMVGFEVTAAGLVPVARHHAALIAGGLAVFLESGLQPDADLLTTIPPASFAGIALTVLPWLLGGGALHLHHGFDPATFDAQVSDLKDGTLVLPGPLLGPLAAAGHAARLANIVALWRAPERLALAPSWRGAAALTDVASFGELGLIASRRDADGMPPAFPLGVIGAPRGVSEAIRVIETAQGARGTLALRGPMLPATVYPPGAGMPPRPARDEAGLVDTGYPCRREDDGLVVTGPPAGMVSVGGYRFASPTLETLVAAHDGAATIAALPDALLGERLAGSAGDAETLAGELRAQGVNPLIAGAFRARRRADAASSRASLTRR